MISRIFLLHENISDQLYRSVEYVTAKDSHHVKELYSLKPHVEIVVYLLNINNYYSFRIH